VTAETVGLCLRIDLAVPLHIHYLSLSAVYGILHRIAGQHHRLPQHRFHLYDGSGNRPVRIQKAPKEVEATLKTMIGKQIHDTGYGVVVDDEAYESVQTTKTLAMLC